MLWRAKHAKNIVHYVQFAAYNYDFSVRVAHRIVIVRRLLIGGDKWSKIQKSDDDRIMILVNNQKNRKWEEDDVRE